MQLFTSVIYIWTYLSLKYLSGTYFEILLCSDVFARQEIINKKTYSFKHVWIFSRFNVIFSQLLQSYAKGPICMMRLIWWKNVLLHVIMYKF